MKKLWEILTVGFAIMGAILILACALPIIGIYSCFIGDSTNDD